MDGFVEQTVRKTVVILDNCLIHKSKKFRTKVQEWKDKDVFFAAIFS